MTAALRTLGEEKLDASHVELARRIAVLADAADADVEAALEAVSVLAKAHFAEEDVELRRLGGEANQCHLDEHAAVLASIAEVAVLVRAGTGFGVARRLGLELARWLPAHVADMDLRLAQALFRRRTGGAVVTLMRPAHALA